MVRISKEILCCTHLKQGHRQEIWMHFMLGHWWDAFMGGDAAFPYIDTKQGRVDVANGQGSVTNTE